MEFLLALIGRRKIEKPKTIADYQREKLIQEGRQQFQKMMELGIAVPIRLV